MSLCGSEWTHGCVRLGNVFGSGPGGDCMFVFIVRIQTADVASNSPVHFFTYSWLIFAHIAIDIFSSCDLIIRHFLLGLIEMSLLP